MRAIFLGNPNAGLKPWAILFSHFVATAHSPIRRHADTPIRRYADAAAAPTVNCELRTVNGEPLTLLSVRYPNILHLGGVPEEFFALALLGGEPVASFTVGDPGRF